MTAYISIGNGEPCPWCKQVLGKDFKNASEHFQDKHPSEFMETLFGEYPG